MATLASTRGGPRSWLVFAMGCASTPARETSRDVTLPEQPSATARASARADAAPPPKPPRLLTAGWSHTCAGKRDGSLWCWGAIPTNSREKDPVLDRFGRPVQVKQLGTDVVEVSAGQKHTCARKRDGTAWCFGGNYFGELGQGTRDALLHEPQQVKALGNRVAELAAGWDTSCARDTESRVWCWGDAPDLNAPGAPPPTERTWIGAATGGLAAGQHYVCARRGDGTLWCDNDSFLFSGPHQEKVLVRQIDIGAVQRVAAGRHHACATRTDGALFCWGSSEAVVGRGEEARPIRSLGNRVVDVALGDDHACALLRDGALFCWGDNRDGQLGDGTTERRAEPVQVAGLQARVIEITAGSNHTCARTEDGVVWCWGARTHGALGVNKNPDEVSTPGRVSGDWP